MNTIAFLFYIIMAVPVRTTRPGTTAGHGVGVGVSSGTLSVLLITFLAVIAIALFLYIRKRRVKSSKWQV